MGAAGMTGTEVTTGESTGKGVPGTEVNGKKPDDGVARDDNGHGGRLSIIEVEVYETNIPKN